MTMNTYTGLSAATVSDPNLYVTTTNMKVGAYTLAATTPATAGARRVTVTHTGVTGTDTLGTIAVVGVGLDGQTLSESIVPLADTVATGTKFFRTITSITGVGWVINTGNDTIVVGVEAGAVVLAGAGSLYAIVVNTTAAGTITVSDSAGTIATLASSIAVGTYRYECSVSGYLMVSPAAASDITVIHSPQLPTDYALS